MKNLVFFNQTSVLCSKEKRLQQIFNKYKFSFSVMSKLKFSKLHKPKDYICVIHFGMITNFIFFYWVVIKNNLFGGNVRPYSGGIIGQWFKDKAQCYECHTKGNNFYCQNVNRSIIWLIYYFTKSHHLFH